MIYISAQRFNNEFRAAQDLGYLLSCIGEKVIIETDFYIEDITWATADNAIILEPDASSVDLSDVDGVISSEDGTAFIDYQVGDKIGVFDGSHTVYEITEKYNDGLIRTTYTGGQATLTPSTHYVYLATAINGVRYAWGLSDQGQMYNSLVDGEFQQSEYALADTDDTSYDTMAFKGILSYQIGSVQVKGRTGAGGTDPNYVKQQFTIKHTTWITPLFLMAQYADLLLRIKPSYFQNNSCLEYCSQIQVNGVLSNPNTFKTLDIPFKNSNVGWFNERFNGGVTNYAVSAIQITNDAVVGSDFEFDKNSTIKITITNATDSPFSNTNTKFTIGFNYLPDDEDFYQNTGLTFDKNFLLDTALQTLGSGAVNGSLYATSYTVLSNITGVYVSNSEMYVQATVNLGSAAKAILQQGNYSRYQIWVIVENHALAAAVSDKVNLLAQVGEFDEILTTTDLITSEHKFLRHPFDTNSPYAEGSGFDMFIADDVAVQTNFSIDFNGLTDDGILIKKIKNEIVLTHATESDIVLDTFTADVSAFTMVDGYVQDIDFEQDRIFKIPDEIRKTITIQRNPDLDSGTVFNWIMNFPFMNRWEFWEALTTINPPTGIYDRNERWNGSNHLWNRLFNVSGWTAVYRTTFELEQNEEDFEQIFETEINSSDFETGTEWDNQTIKSYDLTGATEYENAGIQYILGYEDVLVKASFEKISGLVPASASEVTIVIWIETFESGGIADIRRISSAYEIDSQSWFKSVDTSNKVKITKTGSVFVGEAIIDYGKLPQNTAYTLYARIYDNAGGCSATSILDQDGFCIQDQDGNNIIEQ